MATLTITTHAITDLRKLAETDNNALGCIEVHNGEGGYISLLNEEVAAGGGDEWFWVAPTRAKLGDGKNSRQACYHIGWREDGGYFID